MSSVAWSAIRAAVHAWFVAGSGLAANRVLYTRKNPPRPDGSAAWISLRVSTAGNYGRDWTVYEDHPTPTAGAELIARTRGLRRILVNATCFPPTEAEDATEAHAILLDVLAEYNKPSRLTALSAAGVGLIRFEPITPIDGVMNSTKFEPRALMPFAFLVPSEVTETETFIEIVNVEVDVIDNPARDFTFTVDLEP